MIVRLRKVALHLSKNVVVCRRASSSSAPTTTPINNKPPHPSRFPPSLLRISEEVRCALNSDVDWVRVVALETAVVSHGLPYYANVEAALGMEDEIRMQVLYADFEYFSVVKLPILLI
jgi:hypothetical protein